MIRVKVGQRTANNGWSTARLRKRWSETPTKWSPIPLSLGAAVLVALSFYKQRSWEQVDESKRPVPESQIKVQGPWQVCSLSVWVQRGRSKLDPVHLGSRYRRSSSPIHVATLRPPQFVRTPRLVPRPWLQTLLVHLRRPSGGMRPVRLARVSEYERVLHAATEAGRTSHCRCSACE